MNFNKLHKHTKCFKSAWQCFNDRAPILLWGSILMGWFVMAEAIIKTLFGPLVVPVKHFTSISESETMISVVSSPAPLLCETLAYGVIMAVFITASIAALVFISWFVGSMIHEVQTFKATLKECRCNDDS